MMTVVDTTIARRGFLRGCASALATFPVPSVVPSSVFGSNAPSNRIALGCVGLGGMGMGNLRGFLNKEDTQILAVCDVVTSGRTEYGPNANGCGNKGKDVYCEKPLSLTICEGRIIADAVPRYGRVLQTGTQHRSSVRRRFICELIRNGRIGKLHTIKCSIGGGPSCEPQSAMPVPKGFDYDMWLGQATHAPYTEKRCHYHFRFIWDYAGGQVTNNGVHALDFVQWANGTDLTGPVEIEGRGEFPKDGLFDTPTSWSIEHTYGDGVKLLFSSGKSGVRFEGADGWI